MRNHKAQQSPEQSNEQQSAPVRTCFHNGSGSTVQPPVVPESFTFSFPSFLLIVQEHVLLSRNLITVGKDNKIK